MTSYVDTRHQNEVRSKVVEASVGNLYKGIMADEGHVGEEKPKETVNRTVLQLLILCLLIESTISVDRNNFKTCQQSSFCRRNRGIQEGNSPYSILQDSVKFDSDSIKANLLNSKNNVSLALTIEPLEKNTARIRVRESNPIRPRYECKDSLDKEPAKVSYTKEKEDATGCSIKFDGNSIALTYKPFRLDFFQSGDLVLTMNSRGLMNFEHYRLRKNIEENAEHPSEQEINDGEPPEKKAKEDSSENSEGEQSEKKEENKEEEKSDDAKEEKKASEDEEGMWEESFNSHEDTKPRGPSAVALDISFTGFDHVYGIPEHADSLALKQTTGGDPYRLYSLDVYKYELYNPMALYGSIPFMIGHSKRRTAGVFWNNAAETWVDIKSSKSMLSSLMSFFKSEEAVPEMDTHWISESGIIDVFVLLGPKPHDVFKQYATLTGTTPIPPLFGIAYHQCRWNYNDEEDVKGVDANFDTHDIPYDVIWLDIEHTNGKQYLTWDTAKFPNPKEMQDNLATRGRKMVTIVDPHIKRDSSYHIHSEASEKNLYVLNKDKQQYEGWCWPGSSSWLDFCNPEIREWWATRFAYDKYEGSTPNLFTWNDMNEPSVFNGPEITMHKDALHYGDWEHRDVHNIFGAYVHQATMMGQIQRSGGNERPFVLSRAFFAGSQRFGAVWTGDNAAEWDHLKISIPMCLSIGIAGLPFVGADVGGFFDNPSTELLVRWYQAGSFLPFFRAHAHLDTKRREPWLFDDNTKAFIREAIRRRYILLPYWYTLFRETSINGSPVIRPLWVEYPDDSKTFDIDDEYLVGKDLLVKPVTAAGQTSVDVYFPGGEKELWFDVEDFSTVYNGGQQVNVAAPLHKIPVFQRGGSIIPRKERVRRSSSLTHRDPYTLLVTLNSSMEAYGELYVDDGHSFEYKNGKYIMMKFQMTGSNFIAWHDHSSFETKAWIERIVILGVTKPFKSATLMAVNQMKKLDVGYIAQKKIFVIKKPEINIGNDFSIVFD
ncbi:neutral alpha-glucosidase AB-like isoform X2 [Rhopilema esculentum]|uniref:neutral alpha-glucosidase AB-like isoform X2 n=1 Tax=Rhopilema esculentum TaxID=499914 RepID=UPI0031DB979C